MTYKWCIRILTKWQFSHLRLINGDWFTLPNSIDCHDTEQVFTSFIQLGDLECSSVAVSASSIDKAASLCVCLLYNVFFDGGSTVMGWLVPGHSDVVFVNFCYVEVAWRFWFV